MLLPKKVNNFKNCAVYRISTRRWTSQEWIVLITNCPSSNSNRIHKAKKELIFFPNIFGYPNQFLYVSINWQSSRQKNGYCWMFFFLNTRSKLNVSIFVSSNFDPRTYLRHLWVNISKTRKQCYSLSFLIVFPDLSPRNWLACLRFSDKF